MKFCCVYGELGAISTESAGRLVLAGIVWFVECSMLYRQVMAARKLSTPVYQFKAAATQTSIEKGLVRAFGFLAQGIRRSMLNG